MLQRARVRISTGGKRRPNLVGTHPQWVFTKVAEITEENGSIVHIKAV